MNDNNEIQRVRVNRNLWKTSLTREITHLEDNLDQLYYTAGLKPHRIVRDDENDDEKLTNEKGIDRPELRDYESIIDEQVAEIETAANNICALISSVTEFELQIPVLVLLRLANRIGSIRCLDFKKKVPGTLAKKYIHNKGSLQLIRSSLTLYEWISTILSTNILPFQTFINQNLFNLLAWTRSSHLQDLDKEIYYAIRIQALGIITNMFEHLSLNINFDAQQLTTLIEEELIDGLDQMIASKTISLDTRKHDGSGTSIGASALALTNGYGSEKRSKNDSKFVQDEESIENRYTCQVIQCLDRLFIVYADFLNAKLESKLKNFVLQTCIKIYRDFDQNVIGLACRRQLLHLLETISNRPYATSTTELAWHVFELCDKLESDPEIRYIAKRSLKFGLAHRPTIVSHFDVHDCYAKTCDIHQSDDDETMNETSANLIELNNDTLALTNESVDVSEELDTNPPIVEPLDKTKEMDFTMSSNGCVDGNTETTAENVVNTDNGCSITHHVEVDVDVVEHKQANETVSDKVDTIANGFVGEGGDKIATNEHEHNHVHEHEHVDKQEEDHKVDSVADKRALDEGHKANESDDDEDDQVKPYLDLFVDSLVTKVRPAEK